MEQSEQGIFESKMLLPQVRDYAMQTAGLSDEETGVIVSNWTNREMADNYVNLVNYIEVFEGLLSVIKKEIVTNDKVTGPYGRVMGNPDSVDEKGHRYLDMSDGGKIKAERRHYSTLNPDKVKEVLEPTGYLESAYQELIGGLEYADSKRLLELISTIDAVGDIIPENPVNELEEVFLLVKKMKVQREISEERIMALVALNFITMAQVKNMFDEYDQYAIKVIKPPKKVKAKK